MYKVVVFFFVFFFDFLVSGRTLFLKAVAYKPVILSCHMKQRRQSCCDREHQSVGGRRFLI